MKVYVYVIYIHIMFLAANNEPSRTGDGVAEVGLLETCAFLTEVALGNTLIVLIMEFKV